MGGLRDMNIRENLNRAMAILAPLNMTISYKVIFMEYRVNFKGGQEDTAYYTTDIEDAIASGSEMARHLREIEELVKHRTLTSERIEELGKEKKDAR